ncbi:MAG: leucine-rich repeat domain-containing protein [Clostridiales bacterium]|nr:leucine-rich repeat domain-containing protein [Clostridiales bacterium]
MKTIKQIKALVSFLLVALLMAVSIPFAAMAAVDDCFESGNLMCLVTEEESGNTPGKVKAIFNENIDPATVTSLTVPGTVKHDGKTYCVTALMDGAFGDCTVMTTLDMSDCTALTSIGMYAFLGCEKLTSIIIPCNFNKDLFADSGVVVNGDNFTIENIAESGGTFTYAHNWKPNEKNLAEHICTICGMKARHAWESSENSEEHICSCCHYAEKHYGGTPDSNGIAKCVACQAEYKTEASDAQHKWRVLPDSIGETSAEYKCETCQKVETRAIDSSKNEVKVNGQSLNLILQDPYKVLPDGTGLKTSTIEPSSSRYNELFTKLDDTHNIENIVFFEIDLLNGKGEQISGEIAGKVRILMPIPDGWDKEALEAVLIMPQGDVEFEESIITIDGVYYLAFWTSHFSPYAIIQVKKETTPATGDQSFGVMPSLALVVASSTFVAYDFYNRKRKSEKQK